MNNQQCQPVHIGDMEIGTGRFTLLGGPCALESREMAYEVAREMKRICQDLGIQYVFKASFDKANRSSIFAERGVGMDKGLQILADIKQDLGLPIVTDVHETYQCAPVGEVADIIQIPAFLCRQTDLLVAAAKTGKIVNVKKGQFLAPWDMKNVVAKLHEAQCDQVLLTERGSSYGYNNLVVDMTALVEMRSLGVPVVFDATHSVQKPGGQGTSTGGNRQMIPYLMRAAIATGCCDAVFAEIHPDPDKAISDGPNQLHLHSVEPLLKEALALHNLIQA